MNELNMVLCAGRHEVPAAVDGAVFKEIANIKNVKFLESTAFNSIWNAAYRRALAGEIGFLVECGETFDSGFAFSDKVKLNLYVTGLTVALIAVLNMCRSENIPVTLFHYDRETGEYFKQEVV